MEKLAAGSTNELDWAVRTLPEDVQQTYFAIVAPELARYRAAQAKATRQRSRQIRAGILRAYRDYRALIDRLPPHSRTRVLHQKLRARWRDYGLAQAPGLKTVRATLQEHAQKRANRR